MLDRPDRAPDVAAAMMHRIEIARVCSGANGDRYSATFVGEVIVASSRCAALDACRVLAGRGITGRLAVYWPGSAAPAMVMDIERGAGLTVSETPAHAPRFAPWRPFERPGSPE